MDNSVSESWRIENCNFTFTMKFGPGVETEKVYGIMESALKELSISSYGGIFSRDLRECCGADHFKIDSALDSEEYHDVIPAICKAAADAFPAGSFEGSSSYNDLRCYCVDDYEFSFKDGRLVITETFMDDECGYFCPECGFSIASVDGLGDAEEIECDDCEEIIKAEDLKYVPPAVTKTEYIVKEAREYSEHSEDA